MSPTLYRELGTSDWSVSSPLPMWPLHCQRLEVVADAVSFVEETSAMAISLTSALSAKDYHTKEAPLEQEELAGMGQTSNPSLDGEGGRLGRRSISD